MNKIENQVQALGGRSRFVTIVAWAFIVITAILMLQNIILVVIFSTSELRGVFNESQITTGNVPAIARFMFSHTRLLFCGFFIISTIMFVSSIGLLKRKNWARILFVVILALWVIWNLGNLFIQGGTMMYMPAKFNQAKDMQILQIMFVVVHIFKAIVFIGISIFLGWIAKKLFSKNIKQEFI